MKKRSAWVNGGLIALTVALLGVAIKFQCPADVTCPSDYLFYPVAPIILIAPLQYIFVYYFGFYFLFGALIGFIYGKLKAKREHPARIEPKSALHKTPIFRAVEKVEEDLELALDQAIEFKQEDIRSIKTEIVFNTFMYLGKIAGSALLIVAPLFFYTLYPAAIDPASRFFLVYLGWLLLLATGAHIYKKSRA